LVDIPPPFLVMVFKVFPEFNQSSVRAFEFCFFTPFQK
jgi:hypothetical protein